MTKFDQVCRAYSYGQLTFEQLKAKLSESCDCETLGKPVKVMDDIEEYACQACEKTWFGCGVFGCMHQPDFETEDEVIEHINARHEEWTF